MGTMAMRRQDEVLGQQRQADVARPKPATTPSPAFTPPTFPPPSLCSFANAYQYWMHTCTTLNKDGEWAS